MGSEEDRPEEMQVSPTQPSAGTAFSSVSVDIETGGMRRVPPPVISSQDHPGTSLPSGPQHLVDAWEVELAPQCGDDVLVLSLWTERHQEHPIRFCLSPPAVAQLAQGLAETLNLYLYGSTTATETE